MRDLPMGNRDRISLLRGGEESAVAKAMAGEEDLETCVSAKRTRFVDTEFRADVAGRQGVVKKREIFPIRFVFLERRPSGRPSVGRSAGSGDPRTTGVDGTGRDPSASLRTGSARPSSLEIKAQPWKLRVGEDAAGFVEEDAAEIHLEGFGVGGFEERFLFGDQFGFHQFEERLVESLHAFIGAGFDGGKEFVEAVFFDEFADGTRVEHDLDGGNNAAGGRGNEALADDSLQGGRELPANLVAFVRGEKVESAADRGVRGGRVQRGQHQMAGVRSGEGGHEGLAVAHFSDDDDVGILAHDVNEGAFEAERVEADFALFDDRLFVVEHVLDRVFEGDDVALLGFVDVLDHRGQRAGFTAARGAGHQDDAALRASDFAQLLRQVQILEGRHVRFDEAHYECGHTALIEDVYAEAAEGGVDVRKISFLLAIQAGFEMFGQHVADDFLDLRGGGRIDLDGEQFARDADGGVMAGLYVDVRSRHVDGELQETVQVFHTGQREIEILSGASAGGVMASWACARLGRSRNSSTTLNPLPCSRRAHCTTTPRQSISNR